MWRYRSRCATVGGFRLPWPKRSEPMLRKWVIAVIRLLALAAYRDHKKTDQVRGAIGWVNAWAEPGELRAHPEIERFWRGAFAAVGERRYRLEEFRLGFELSAERRHGVLETRSIRGLIVPPHLFSEAWNGFPWESYAVVSFGRCCNAPRGHGVVPSAAANLLLAIGKFARGGSSADWMPYRQLAAATAGLPYDGRTANGEAQPTVGR